MSSLKKIIPPKQETNSSSPRFVVVREVPIELCQFIKFGGLSETGGEAKQLISSGLVLLNGVVETQKRKKLAVGDKVKANGHTIIVKLA
jgi:ribosome-associated protein